MSSLVILILGLAAVINLSNKIEIQALNINQILKLVQRNPVLTGKQHRLRLRISSESDSDSESDESLSDLQESDDSDHNRLARLRKERIIDLLETVGNEKSYNDLISYRKEKKNNGQTLDKSDNLDKLLAKERIIDLLERATKVNSNNDRITNRKEKPIYRQTSYLLGNENYRSAKKNIKKETYDKLYSQASDDEKLPSMSKKRLIPNRLTPTVTMDDVEKYYENKNNEATGLQDYSKVYIVLNPQAVRNSKNKNSLTDLISNVLSLSSPTSKREDKTMPHRYKGFVLNETNTKRRFRAVNDDLPRTPEDKIRLYPVASLGEITAMPK